ncbi:hypothetical protein BFP72_12090 [Reichenbachiella sp. 5M10]|uniref:sensor histidine kinase n=1 Tax=Reichenbachiella sp. 5M10 TaxID=1889772 RepID=UPI000C14686A|nr:PAS domain-containing sensor histidine kinase [Reichenbachiella sp. 5M10]PIB36081.1 hypothetical protein BFP72_12090 [Reichenbachiella sp. 5M10]
MSSEKHLLDLINHSHDRLWSYDRDLICLVVNEVMRQDYQLAFGEALKPGMHVLDHVPEPLCSQWEARYRKVLDGETQVFVERFDMEGIPEYMQVTIVPIIEGGQIIGGACTSRNMSEQRRAEIKVLQNEAYLIAQIENTTNPIWSVDRNYRLLTINSAMNQGYLEAFDVDLKVGDDIVSSIPEGLGIRDSWKERYQRALTGERFSVIEEYDVYEEPVFVEISYNPIRVGDEILGVACFSQDITAIRNSELALKKEVETKDKFFSIIAHDLRGPVGNIRELVKLLTSTDAAVSVEQKKQVVAHLEKTSIHVYELLDKLLTWALSQQKMVQVSQEKVNVAEVVEESIRAHRSSAVSKGVSTIVHVDPKVELVADKRLLMSTIANIYNNAVKYTQEQGRVTIEMEDRGAYYQFCVKDTGVGMNATLLKTLFDESEMQTQPGTKNEKGTGLGLLLCQEFIKLNQGEIWVESEPGIGSSFYFTIPKSD